MIYLLALYILRSCLFFSIFFKVCSYDSFSLFNTATEFIQFCLSVNNLSIVTFAFKASAIKGQVSSLQLDGLFSSISNLYSLASTLFLKDIASSISVSILDILSLASMYSLLIESSGITLTILDKSSIICLIMS